MGWTEASEEAGSQCCRQRLEKGASGDLEYSRRVVQPMTAASRSRANRKSDPAWNPGYALDLASGKGARIDVQGQYKDKHVRCGVPAMV
jgi:hypothetical protein